MEKDGNVVFLPRIEGEKNHGCAFTRLEEVIPNILFGYAGDRNFSSGFELANFVAANGRVVFWPSNINNPEFMIVTLPQTSTDEQVNEVTKIFPQLKGYYVCANTAHFKNARSSKVVSITLSSSGDFDKAERAVLNYFSLSSMINEGDKVINNNQLVVENKGL